MVAGCDDGEDGEDYHRREAMEPESYGSRRSRRDRADRLWTSVRAYVRILSAVGRSRYANNSTSAGAVRQDSHQERIRRRKEDPGLAEDWKKARSGEKAPGYGISKEELNFLARYHYLEGLQSVQGVVENVQGVEKNVQGVEALVRALRSHAENGIPPGEVEERLEVFGSNRYPKKRMKSFLQFLGEAFRDAILIILIICAIASVVVGIIAKGKETGWYDGVAISVAVILVVVVTSASDYKQALQFRGISEVKDNIFIKVSRDGSRERISIWDLAVGDVVHLQSGDRIPGDGVLIQGHNLLVDESSMTGESVYVKKDEKLRPFLMSGCKVADGQGRMLVIAVGVNTEWGRIMATLSNDSSDETPLQVRLNGVATFIGMIGLVVAVLVLVVLLIRFAVDAREFHGAAAKIKEIVNIIEVAVAIVVVSVPEGLPLAVTLTLAYSMRKMMADNAFVRKLAACETMGSATTICSDKTGTLTKNEMEVVRAWVAGRHRDADEVRKLQASHAEFYAILMEGLIHNVEGDVSEDPKTKVEKVHASPTEAAILKWGLTIGMRFREMKRPVLKVEPFNSTRKRSGVVMQLRSLSGQSSVRVHWKGASEIVLEMCQDYYDAEAAGSKRLTNAKREELLGAIEEMATAGLRTLVLAYCEVREGDGVPGNEQQAENWTVPSEKLICLAILGIKDPCRPGVQGAVAKCQKAGVKVRMVTGDNLITARTIAIECGILRDEAAGVVMEGSTFRRLSPAEKREAVKDIVVMARSSPTDKFDLVRALRENGDVVAVTGDGTNDAPALHEADVGLAMGIAGTEVAKDSADIVILDDNFASIVKVVRWGRSVYANIQKFIQFQLTVNVVALTLNFIAALAGTEIPLTTVQLLWVNLIMDTFGALALATEPPHDKLLQRDPVGRTEPLITNQMWHNILGQAVYQIAILLLLQSTGEDMFEEPDDVIRSMIFNAFVFCQLFNEINSRKPDELNVIGGILRNHIFVGILLITAFVQALIINFAEQFANTKRLRWDLWIVCIVIGLCGMPVAALVKLIPTKKEPYVRGNLFRRNRRKRTDS